MTGRPQGCKADGQAPELDLYQCDRCDLAHTGTCGGPHPDNEALDRSVSVQAVRALTVDRLAKLYEILADAAERDEPTSYTHPALYAATARLVQAHLVKLEAADVICGGKPQPAPQPTIHRL